MRALVLCGGYGRRLGALTGDRPKPLLPVGPEPLLVHTLRHLCAHGFDEVAVNLHYLGDRIRAALAGSPVRGVRVTFIEEPVLLGTAGTVRAARQFLFGGAHPECLVIYGDILTDQDLGALLALHRDAGAAATVAVHQRASSNSRVEFDHAHRVTRFDERPAEATGRTWVNSGIQVLAEEFVDVIPPGDPRDLPADVYTRMAGGGRLFALPLGGYRCAIDSPERYAEACAAVAEGRCVPGRRP